jgi:phytoene synthase
MRILPRPQREAMFEIYAFCRAVDDIADDPGPREPRLAALAKWRSDIDAVYAGAPPPPLAGLARAVREFDLQREDFLAIIDGMEMDVVTDIRAPDRATLDLYCDRVACDLDEDAAMGRLYLPRETLRDAGIISTDPPTVLSHPLLDHVCNVMVVLAKVEFDAANAIMARTPRRIVRAPRIMAQAYRLILDRLIARGFTPPRAPVRLPRAKVLLIVLRNLI